MIAWLFDLLVIFRAVQSSFLSWSVVKLDEIIWNGQTIVMQTMLVEKFGAGITIVNNRFVSVLITYPYQTFPNPIEYPFGYGNRVTRPFGFNYSAQYNFKVQVPASLGIDISVNGELYYQVRKYAMVGTNFQIVLV